MSFGSFSWCIIFSTLYCLILSFILFSNTAMTHFSCGDCYSFKWSNCQWKIHSYLLLLCLWIILKSAFMVWIGFYNLGGNCALSQSRVTFVSHGFVWACLSLLLPPVMPSIYSQRAASSRTASRVCRRGTWLNQEKEPSKDLCSAFALT